MSKARPGRAKEVKAKPQTGDLVEVNFPGENLVGALKWFNDNKSRIDGMIAWFEANSGTIADLIKKVDTILGFLKQGERDHASRTS